MTLMGDTWGSDWTVGVRVWMERAGRAILGKGRLELLEAIERWHSISAAARQIGMSYRHAWLLVQGINEAAGEPFVVAATGGARGGGARLTPHGRQAAAVFHQLQDQLHRSAGTILSQLVQSPAAPVVHVAASVSLEEVLGQLLADYALRRPDVRVRTVFGSSDELANHLLAGAPGELFLTADAAPLARLQQAGLASRSSGVALAENTLCAIAPADRKIAVRKPAHLTQTELRRLAVAEPACPLGSYTRAYLDDLGLLDVLQPRILFVDNSRAVVTAVKAGHADVGLVYGSDALRAEGIRLLFRARDLPVPIRYVAAVLERGQPTPAARELLAFLTSEPAAVRFRRCGFLPPAADSLGA